MITYRGLEKVENLEQPKLSEYEMGELTRKIGKLEQNVLNEAERMPGLGYTM